MKTCTGNDAPLRVTPNCPKCGFPVVYNGNYFCSRTKSRLCDWALSNRRQEHDYAVLLSEGKIKRVDY